MRAGYIAFALGVIVPLLVVAALHAPTPTAVPAGPIATDLGLAGPDPPDLERRRAAAVAAATTRCMAGLGFAFVAEPDPPPSIPDADLDPVAWARRWGFGVTTAAGDDGSALSGASDVSTRSVTAVIAALEPAEQPRFRLALYGDGTGAVGCQRQAADAVFGLRERLLAPLATPLTAIERAIEADPALDDARRRFVACATRGLGPMGAADRAPVHDRGALPVWLLDWFGARLQEVAGSPGALVDLQDLERRTATAIARCELRFAHDRAIVARPHEIGFVDRYGRQLAGIGAAIRAAEDAYPRAP